MIVNNILFLPIQNINTRQRIPKRQSRDTGNIWYTRRRRKQNTTATYGTQDEEENKTQHNMKVETNRTSFLCGNPSADTTTRNSERKDT